MKLLKWILILIAISLLTTFCSSDSEDDLNPPVQITDVDKDGVADSEDNCPQTPADEEADENGCSASQRDSDGDGVTDDADQCPDTPADTEVNDEGCSAAQSDTTAPEVLEIEVTEIGPDSFKVKWELNEDSKGYIRFGNTSGNYTDSTNIDEDYLTTHIQTVGGENQTLLNPNTTYYWQIYVEDEVGNSGYWEEQTTKTAQEQQRTYIPDDAFEQYLIEKGFDDVLDDYVITEHIMELKELEIPSGYPYSAYKDPIKDWTGIQDFSSLEKLFINDDYQENIISTLDGLEIAPALKTLILWSVNGVPLVIKNFPQLETFSYGSFGDYGSLTKVIEIMDNPNLRGIHVSGIEIEDENTTGNIKIENNPDLEMITTYGTKSNIYEISNNPSLTALSLGRFISGDEHCDGCLSTNVLSLNNNTSLNVLTLERFITEENVSVANCPSIKIIRVKESAFNKIDLTQLTALEELYLEEILSLDISKNTSLKILEITDSYGPGISNLDVSNNPDLTTLNINGHDLKCIKVNQSQLNNIPATWEVYPPVPFTLDCN